MKAVTGVLAVTVAVAAAVMMLTAPAMAMDVELTSTQIEAALKIARGDERTRAPFHRAYMVPVNDPSIERIEVITEFRRLVLIAEARIAGGDHLFAQGTREASEALRPWRGRVSLVAHLRFHPQNAYVMGPPIDVSVDGPSGRMPRLDLRSESTLGLAPRPVSPTPTVAPQSLPLISASAEAVFDAATIGQATRSVVVQLHGAEPVRATVDFSRIR